MNVSTLTPLVAAAYSSAPRSDTSWRRRAKGDEPAVMVDISDQARALDPKLKSTVSLLERSLGQPIYLRDPEQSGAPRARVALNSSGTLQLELDTIDSTGVPSPGTYKVRGLLYTTRGEPTGFDVVVEMEGQAVRKQHFDMRTHAVGVDSSLNELAGIFGKNLDEPLVFEVVETG